MKKILSMSLVLAMVLGLAACGTTTGGAAPADSSAPNASGDSLASGTIDMGEYEYSVEEAALRALAWQACSNLAGAHEDYHTALNHAGELEDLWVTEEPYTSTMSWTNNTQKMVGYDNIYAFYVTDLTGHIEMCTSAAAGLDETGEIDANADEWQGSGMFWYHMLMSPEIEVAADGQTAIGHWQSFGTVTEPSGMSGYTAQWTCEDYNMVFVKQSDGEWRIWHLRTFVHFYTNVDNHWYEQNMATQGAGPMEVPTGVGVMADAEGAEIPEEILAMMASGDAMPKGGGEGGDYAEMGEYYQGFDVYCVPKQTGNVKPYKTWSDIEDTFLW